MADFQAPPGVQQFTGPSGHVYSVPPSGVVTITAFDTLAAFNAGFYPVVTGIPLIKPNYDGGSAKPEANPFYLGDGGEADANSGGVPPLDGGGA